MGVCQDDNYDDDGHCIHCLKPTHKGHEGYCIILKANKLIEKLKLFDKLNFL